MGLPALKMPISAVELQEYLYSSMLSEAVSQLDRKDLQLQMRASFRLQRFALMNWLIMNGVSIPSELLSDGAHPQVGAQFPDQKWPNATVHT